MNTWNEDPRWLKAAVFSYQNQQGVELELIISTVFGDKNTDFINSTGAKVVFSYKPDVYGQINLALKEITGDWFCYASSNDIAEPFKLRQEYERCIKDNKLVCYSQFNKTDERLRPISTVQARPYNYDLHLTGNFVNDCALVHTSLIKKYGPFRCNKWGNHSYHDFWLRIYEGEGDVFTANPNTTWHYRKHSGLREKRQKDYYAVKDNEKLRKRMIQWHKQSSLGSVFERITADEPDAAVPNLVNIRDKMDNDIDTMSGSEGINEGVNDGITDFVYVWIAQPAKWQELAFSIKSIRSHFLGRCRIFVVGDNPGLTSVIHIPADKQKGRAKDICNKLQVITNTPAISDDFIYCYDDQILLKDINREWFNKVIANDHVRDHTTYFKGARGTTPSPSWQSLFRFTFALLTKHRLPTYNYETHLPRMMNKGKIRQAFVKFGRSNIEQSLFNSLYFNLHYEKPDVLIKSPAGAHIKAGIHRSFSVPEKLIAELKGKTWLNYNDSGLTDAFKKVIQRIMKKDVKL